MALGDMIRKAKGYARQNPDKTKQMLDKIENTVDQKTQGKYRDKVSKASNAVGGALGVERGQGQQGQVSGEGFQGQQGQQAQGQPWQGQQGQGQQAPGSGPTAQGGAPEWKSPTEGTDPRPGQ